MLVDEGAQSLRTRDLDRCNLGPIYLELLEPISAQKTWSISFYDHKLLYLIAVLDADIELPHNFHLLLRVGPEGEGAVSQRQVGEQ